MRWRRINKPYDENSFLFGDKVRIIAGSVNLSDLYVREGLVVGIVYENGVRRLALDVSRMGFVTDRDTLDIWQVLVSRGENQGDTLRRFGLVKVANPGKRKYDILRIREAYGGIEEDE